MRIYHTSDLHDRRHIAARLKALRAQRPGRYVDCGDSLRGSQTVVHRREPIVDVLHDAGLDLQAMGNREFHYLQPVVRWRIAAMRYPVVCANLVDARNRPLPFAPFRDLDVGGATVRFAGLLVVQYPDGSPWQRIFGWRFLDPVAALRSIANATPDDVTLVALSHLGLRADRALAAAVPRLDLILGGHSHDTTPEPERVAGVPIVHAGPYGAFASRTELEQRDGRARVAEIVLEPLA